MRLVSVACIGFVIVAVLFCTAFTSAQDVNRQDEDVWNRIAPFFQPPGELDADLGDYASPLVFDDGRSVRTPEEWQQRRKEILRFWHGALGPWPALIERPAVEVLRKENRKGFLQNKVRLQAAPKLDIEGYLLVPPGDGPRPAVLVVYYDAETGVGLNPKSKLRDFGYQLTRRGFVSLSIGWPRSYTQPTATTRWPTCQRSIQNGWESWAIRSAASGRCLLRASTTSSPARPTLIQASCSTRNGPT
jgi:hypothetical protein